MGAATLRPFIYEGGLPLKLPEQKTSVNSAIGIFD